MSKSNQAGYTLAQLIVVAFIISILASISIPLFFNKTQHVRTQIFLREFAQSIESWRLSNNYYPDDINSSQAKARENLGKPGDWIQWPSRLPSDVVFDYDHWPLGNNRCYAQVAFWGADGKPNYEPSKKLALPGLIEEIGDDLVLGIYVYDCPCSIQESMKECRERTGDIEPR